MMMSFLSNTSTGKKQKEQQDAEELHRKRVAQILRYISTMQITGSNLACQQFSFVRTLDDPRQRYGPFFQDMKSTAYEDDIGGGRILFSLFDFQRLASLLADERAQLPFTFYTARSNAANQRNFLGNHHTTSSDSCWLRLTRLTGADVPSPPPLSPPIIDFLQSWLGNDRSMRLITLSPTGSSVLQQLETLLSWDQLRQPIPPTATPKVQRWWRRYTYYRKLLQLQRQLEPLYNHLFEWYHQTQESSSMGSGDSLDLIWGLGQAQKRVRDTVIDGPLLEVRVEVELARDGALLVRPKEHAGVALNRYVLGAISSSTNNATEDVEAKSGGESLTIRQLRQLVEGMNASDLSPGEPSTYVSLLKRMAVELSSGGTFQSSTNIKKSKRLESLLQQGQLVVTDAWCLYSSPRPTAVWARDAWTFAEKLSMNSSQMTIPQALKALTLGPGALDETNDSNEDTPNPSSLAKALAWFQMTKKAQLESRTMKSRPPFPLPTSDAQNRIADLLMTRKYPAVVCEGPPGTGKTHTIANIVCAYLCQGKRVLVTSKGAPALSVLRERLPECVQELCVDVSKSESSGMRQLQQTVERLANKVAWVNTEREFNKSKALQESIQELEDELASIDQRLCANADMRRQIVQTQAGQDFFEYALELIDCAPWLMKTMATWDAMKIESFYNATKSLVVDPDDVLTLVDGFNSPPSDALISMVAAKAGLALSYLKNATKEVFAKVPLLGSRLAEHCAQVHEQLESIRVDGLQPRSTDTRDWYIVLERLKRDKAIHNFCNDTLEPLFSRESWPRDLFVEIVNNKKQMRKEIIPLLEKAVHMKRVADELELIEKRSKAIEMEKLDKRRADLSSRIQRVAEELVASRVVAELSKNFSAEAQSALVKFAQVSGKAKFGKSTQGSKMTQRQRRKRQEYLDAFEKCVRYIPCWILTSSQISDYLPSECLFDLVVIDEASQSDVTVLPGMLRGRQWLIVGDGKQVSPTESFVAEEQIEMLKSAMPESPFEASMLPGHSFFDLCAQAFPVGRVILREHFRCSPEIISYSNTEFYNGNLIPLRLPTSEERLSPSLIDVFLPNGRKVGKINEKECDEIVNQIGCYIESCSLLRKRSIGVISLVGDEQSRLIRGRLLDRVGPHKYKLHDILVGEPPSFQGAERDIVFLSMVCSPGSVVTQSQLMHAQRVNVALSRARDRMVLVRSIDTSHIPNEQDVKFSVLNFFEQAKHLNGTTGDGMNICGTNSCSTFRARAERLLVKLLKEEGFSTLSMGVVWDNAICIEGSGSSGRRAAICVEATGEMLDDWKAMLEQQKSIERVGWHCMRVDAVSFLANYSDVFSLVRKFLSSAMVYPTERPQEIHDAGIHAPEDVPEDVEMNQAVVLDQPIEIEDDADARLPERQEDQLVVISSDDENTSNSKPAAILRISLKQEREDMDRLGNGESAADYGNVADLGFLGMKEIQEDSDHEDDDDNDDVFAPNNVSSNVAVASTVRRNRKRASLQLSDDKQGEKLTGNRGISGRRDAKSRKQMMDSGPRDNFEKDQEFVHPITQALDNDDVSTSSRSDSLKERPLNRRKRRRTDKSSRDSQQNAQSIENRKKSSPVEILERGEVDEAPGDQDIYDQEMWDEEAYQRYRSDDDSYVDEEADV